MKILVTGSSGGIGSVLVPHLCDKGFDVIGIDLVPPPLQLQNISNFTFIKGSIQNCEFDLKPYVEGIEYVVHLAATSSLPECESNPQEAFHNNFMGTIRLIDFFSIHKLKRFINASTSAVYEGLSEIPFRENMILKPHLIYPQTKLVAENYLESIGITRNFPSTSLRFFNVLGPYQSYTRKSPPLLNYLIREYLANRQPVLHSDGNQKRDYISVYDICSAIELALLLNHEGHQSFNICSETALSVRDIDSHIRKYVKTTLEPVYREPEMLWNDYQNLYNSEYPLKTSIVAEETNKTSLGSSKKFQEISGWKIEYPVEEVIQEICEKAIDYLSGIN